VPTWEGEAQGYTDHDANMQVKDGALLVTARKEKYQYPDGDRTTYEYTAARLETFDSHNNQEIPNGLTFEYGKIEIVAKLPEGKGVFAAPLWLLSANNPVAAKRVEAELAKLGNVSEEEYAEKESQLWGKYYKLGGELDFESYGDANKVELTHHTMNTGKYGDGAMLTVKDATEKFHKYGIAVTPDKVTWYIDDKEVRSFKKTSDNAEDWPFGNGNKLYAVTNLAMRAPEGGKIDNSKGPWHMPIKRLSFYEYKGDK
jgi:beta-glucanase (GH16 family)